MKDFNWMRKEIIGLRTSDKNGQGFVTGFYKAREEAIKIIDQVDISEKRREIEIPDFVDLWIRSNSSMGWWRKIAQWEDEVSEGDREVHDWYQDYNEDTFIVAWITKEYAVVKKKSYFAKLKSISFPNSNPVKNLSRPYYWTVEETLGFEEEGVFIYPTPDKSVAGVFEERVWRNMGISESNAEFIEFVGEDNE